MSPGTGRHAALLLAAGLLAYLGLPGAAVQWANMGLLREGARGRREIALTFDDGPDPDTTPAVLDALRAAGMGATFFVLAPRAEAHPALIRRMLAEGHGVEAHGVRHVHAWWRSPLDAWRDPGDAARRIAAVGGRAVTLHRPPHGAYTLFTLLGQRRAGLRGAHWSLEGGDWGPGATPDGVQADLLARLVPGAVIVLHDAGPGARTTGPMLPGLLAALRERGYSSVPLSRLDGLEPVGRRALVRRAFIALDRLFDRLGHIRPAGGRADNLFRVGLSPLPIHGLRLADGPLLRGTPGAEFHVNNPLLVDLGPRRAVRQAREDFRALARDLRSRPELRGAQAVYCQSALSPLLGLLGFETHDLPAAPRARLRRWANVLRLAYGSAPGAQEPRLSILSREAFLRRFG